VTDAHELYDAGRRGPVLRLHVQPGAGPDGIMGAHGNALKLRVQAPAVSGKANEAVLRLLAREFGSPSASLRLTAGVPVAEFADRLACVLARSGAAGPR